MKKTLSFSAKLDTQEFDRTIEALQKKLKDIYQTSEQGRNSFQTQGRLAQAGLGPAANPMQRALQEDRLRRDTDRFIKQQIKDQEKLAKTLNDQLEAAKKLEQQVRKLAQGTEERTKAEQKLLEMQEKAAKTNAQFKAKEVVMNDALSRRPDQNFLDRLAVAYSKGDISGAMRATGRFARQNPLQFYGGIASGALTAAATAGNIYGSYQQLPANISVNAGAAQGIENRILQDTLTGGGLEEQIFATQRKEARDEALQFRSGQRKKDFWSSLLGLVASPIGGAMAGSKAGGWRGGIIGGVGGLLAGMGTFGSTVLGLAGIGKYGEDYEKRLDLLQNQKMQDVFAGKKELDPMRKLLSEDFKANSMANLQAQRAAGMSDDQLDSFLGGVTGAKFTRGMGRQSLEAILAAGGSTRGAIGGATTSLKAARDFNLTNADQIMGRLSGTIGSSEASNRALFGIMSAAMKEGLDKSEFAAENRKFSQAVADIVYRSGTESASGAASIANQFGSMISSKTTRGIESAQAGFDYMNSLMEASSGQGSVVEMGSMMNDKDLKKLGFGSMAAIQDLTLPELEASLDMPFMERARRSTGLSKEEFRKKIIETKNKKFKGSFIGNKDAFDTVKRLGAKKGVLSTEEYLELEDAKGKVQETLVTQGRLSPEVSESVLSGWEKGEYKTLADLESDINKQKEVFDATKSTRRGDKQIEAAAEGDEILTKLSKTFNPEVDKAAESMKKLKESVDPLVDAILKANSNLNGTPTDTFLRKEIQDNFMKLSDRLLGKEAAQPQVTPASKE